MWCSSAPVFSSIVKKRVCTCRLVPNAWCFQLSPEGDDVPTFVIGANADKMGSDDVIVSNASCTTNCLVPMILVLDRAFGVEQLFMNTIHAYTSDQNLQDGPHRDLRRARNAAQNIVPTSTGAAKAVVMVAPHLKGKIEAHSMRVPVATGSVTDCVCVIKNAASKEEMNAAFKAAAESHLKGILEYCDEPIVSSDIVGNTHSVIFDSELTQVNGNTCRIVGWYDNESGYSARLAQPDCHGLISPITRLAPEQVFPAAKAPVG
jgi:glyceraldehyde 3-phosphate dehydrogenase